MAEITLISEDLDLGSIIANILKPIGHSVFVIPDSRDTVKNVLDRPADIVLFDIKTFDENTSAKIASIADARPAAKLILLINLHERHSLSPQIRLHIDTWITKPFKVGELISAIETTSKIQKHHPALI
jgi:DNA-binding response OmpR family regulator